MSPSLKRFLPTLLYLARRWGNNRIVSGCVCVSGIAALVLAVNWGSQGFESVDKITFLHIATGSTSGTYFAVGKTLASVVSHPPGAESCDIGGRCGVPGLIAIARTTQGSVDNVRSVNSGLFESGLVKANIAYGAFWSEGAFADEPPLDRIRVISNLYSEAIHLVAHHQSGITSVEDLRGKRVALDQLGSGTRADALTILSAYGISPADIEIYDLNSSTAADMMLAGELDAFFLISGPPNRYIAYLADRGTIRLVPINGAPAQRLVEENRFLYPMTLPPSMYNYIGEVETLAVGASWIVNEAVDDDLVYEILRTLFHPANRARLYGDPESIGHIALRTTVRGVPIFLHPGAKRYYLEIGLLEN